MGREDLIGTLNLLLEAERAGAKTLAVFAADHGGETDGALLDRVRRDEGRFAGMLARHIERLGGAPSGRTGDFYDKAVMKEGLDERLRFLNRGQGWVVRKLEEILPLIDDAALAADLEDMRAAHVENIAACDRLLDGGGAIGRER